MASTPSLRLTAASTKITEGNSGSSALRLTASLSEATSLPVTFTATAKSGTATAGLDFQEYTKVLQIPAGETQVDFYLQVLGDTASEANETLSVELSKVSSNAMLSNELSTLPISLQIIDNDKPIARVSDVKVTEGDNGLKNATITVNLNTVATSDVTLNYKTVDGVAKAGSDYIADSDRLVIPKGSKEGSIKIGVQGDTLPEASESFYVELSNIEGALFLGSAEKLTSTVTINTDDDKLFPTLDVKATGVYEGGEDEITDYSVRFALSAPSASDVAFTYEIKDGMARAGSDFEGKSGSIIFLPGESEQILNINILGDSEVEDDEEFILLLSDPNGLKFKENQPTTEVTLLIRDDDEGGETAPQKLEGTAKNDQLDATANGGFGNDTLNGLAGSDTMIGGDGDDSYYVDNPKDVVLEADQSDSAAGDDDIVYLSASSYTLPSNVEHVIVSGKAKTNATGNNLNNRFTGSAAVNVFSGLGGDDTIDGGTGKDTLTGGEGDDVFVVSGGVKGSKNIDQINDFKVGEDKIYLNHEIFTAIAEEVGFIEDDQAISLSNANVFLAGAKVKATSSSSYLLYDTKSGRVFYDADGIGKGTADWFLTLVGKPNISADDFYIF